MPEAAARRVISRRSALRALCSAALVAVAGCRPSSPSADATGAASGRAATANGHTPSASEALARRIGNEEKELIAAYDDAIAAHPQLTDLLEALRADHVKHLLALVPDAPTSAAPTSSTPSLKPSVPPASVSSASSGSASSGSASSGSASSGTTSSGTTSSGQASSPPSSASAVLGQLVSLEQQAASARVDDLMTSSGSLARLLGSIGGCEAAHAALLKGAAQ